MAIRNYKPTTNGRRKMSTLINTEITTDKPEKSLVVTIKKNGGRNNPGRITVRHKGGGEKRKYRIIYNNQLRYVNIIDNTQILNIARSTIYIHPTAMMAIQSIFKVLLLRVYKVQYCISI